MDEIKIYDGLVSLENSNYIKNIMMLEGKFPWYIQAGIGTLDYAVDGDTRDDNTFEYHQFIHHFILGDNVNSSYMSIIKMIVEPIQTKLKKNFVFSRIKANLQTKVNSDRKLYNSPHVDLDKQHLVMLYYVNDSDSKTYIFKNCKKPWVIEKEIDSVQGRLVLFNGNKYHAGSHPFSGVRVVINFNIIEMEDI